MRTSSGRTAYLFGAGLAFGLTACTPSAPPTDESKVTEVAEFAPDAAQRPAAEVRASRFTPPFETRVELMTPGKPTGVLIHDFDDDGASELFAVTTAPGSLCAWDDLNQRRTLAIDDYALGPVVLGELLAVASRSTNTLLLVETKTRELTLAQTLPTPGRARAIGVGPVRDGKPTLVLATNDGQLAFLDDGEWISAPIAAGLVTFVNVSQAGVFVGTQDDASVRRYTWTGDEWASAWHSRTGGIPRRMLTSEGQLWIAAGDRDLLQYATDSTLPQSHTARHATGAIPIDLARLNSRTFALLTYYDLTYHVLQDGREIHSEYAGQDPWSIASGDLNGDAQPDLVFANRGASRVSVLLGKQPGEYLEARRLATSEGPARLACGDLDGNGLPEIAVTASKAGELVLLADASRPHESKRFDAHVEDVCFADIDADGDLDLIALELDGGRTKLSFFEGDGAGQLVHDEGSSVVVGSGSGALWAGDIDADGQVDVLAVERASGIVRRFERAASGSATWRLVTELRVPDNPRSIASFQLDDGTLEFALATGEPGPRFGIALLRVAADGEQFEEFSFIAIEGFPLDVHVSTLPSLALAVLKKPERVDGAGVLEMVSLNSAGEAGARTSYTTGLRPYSLACADVDGDGFDDFVVGAQNSHHINHWRGSDAGLVRGVDLGAGLGTLDVCIRDWNGDGAPDVIAANNFSNDVSVLLANERSD